MTEQIKSAISFLTRYKGCQYEMNPSECAIRKCINCEFDYNARYAENDINTAIRSLQAWEEVLNELEELKQNFKNDRNIHEAIAVNISIKRIEQKLAEIEE